jgi:hypothetical protein
MNSAGGAFVFTSPTGLGWNAFYWEDFDGGIVDAKELEICFEKSGGVSSIHYSLSPSSLATQLKPATLHNDIFSHPHDQPSKESDSNANHEMECDFSMVSPGDFVMTSLREACLMDIATLSFDGSQEDYAHGRAAGVFDSSNPTRGNKQLGSPNKDCANAGPGEGTGGSPLHQANQAYQNCKAQRNLLIVPHSYEEKLPIPAQTGGCIKFSFVVPVVLKGAGVLDIPPGTTVMYTVSSFLSFPVSVRHHCLDIDLLPTKRYP